MLEIMLPAVFPVQAQVQAQVQAPVQAPVAVPVVVNVPLVAAGVQQLVGQIQDLVVQNVAIVQPPVAMEVEGDNETLKRLFLKRFGRELPEREERNEVDDIVGNMDLIDLTKDEDEDEMEVATSEVVQVVVVKTETPEAAPIDDRRRSSRLGRLRKTDVIKEKEAPLAAENVIADNDTDMAEDKSVESVNTVEPLTSDEAFEMAEQAIAESDAAIAENQKVIDGFYNTK
jgi:hypothetical protein